VDLADPTLLKSIHICIYFDLLKSRFPYLLQQSGKQAESTGRTNSDKLSVFNKHCRTDLAAQWLPRLIFVHSIFRASAPRQSGRRIFDGNHSLADYPKRPFRNQNQTMLFNQHSILN
jgi:hypothetical protein